MRALLAGPRFQSTTIESPDSASNASHQQPNPNLEVAPTNMPAQEQPDANSSSAEVSTYLLQRLKAIRISDPQNINQTLQHQQLSRTNLSEQASDISLQRDSNTMPIYSEERPLDLQEQLNAIMYNNGESSRIPQPQRCSSERSWRPIIRAVSTNSESALQRPVQQFSATRIGPQTAPRLPNRQQEHVPLISTNSQVASRIPQLMGLALIPSFSQETLQPSREQARAKLLSTFRASRKLISGHISAARNEYLGAAALERTIFSPTTTSSAYTDSSSSSPVILHIQRSYLLNTSRIVMALTDVQIDEIWSDIRIVFGRTPKDGMRFVQEMKTVMRHQEHRPMTETDLNNRIVTWPENLMIGEEGEGAGREAFAMYHGLESRGAMEVRLEEMRVSFEALSEEGETLGIGWGRDSVFHEWKGEES